MIDLSVVIPIRNEAPSLLELHRELTETLEGAGRSYEIIIVDDGSSDEGFAILAGLQATDSRLRVIRLRRNFGQTAAFAAGFAHARGRLIVTSDGDLQNDPRDIPAMVAMLEGGFDIVCGWRKRSQRQVHFTAAPSMIANGLISTVTGVHLHDYGCSLKVFRAEIVKEMKLYGEMHRFLPAIASEQDVGHRRDGREPSRPQVRAVQVRHRTHGSRHPRFADGQVSAELCHTPVTDFRPRRPWRWVFSARSSADGWSWSGGAMSRPWRTDPCSCSEFC